jgi:uncharacterized protein YbjQ (UPF0145 family)
MSEWDGRGLPPVAAERVRRAAAGGAWTSLLSVPAAAGLEAVGLEPVGEVMGSIVQRIGWAGYGGCGVYGTYGMGWGPAPTVTSSSGRFAGYGPYVEALRDGYRTALDRMALEAAAIGADGVVGVALSQTEMEGSTREFTALGTGVRARSSSRPRTVFTTHLPGTDTAKLLQSGWAPAALVFGISVAIRHDDWTTQRQASWSAGNTEVDGYTELVTHCRADARHRFADQVRRTGADGAVVDDMSLRVWSIEPSDNHRDHVAESTVFGTAVARFHAPAADRPRPLTYLPLRRPETP